MKWEKKPLVTKGSIFSVATLTAALSCGASDSSSASGAGGGGGGDGTGTGTDIDIPQDETCGNGTIDPGELCYELQTANWPVDGPRSLAMRDLDGDGLADVISGDVCYGPTSENKGARVIWGNPEGRIDATQPLPYPPDLPDTYWDVKRIAPGDFNGNGRVDIALWDYTLTLAANQGDRSFTSAVVSADNSPSPALIGVGEVDGDGVEDLVVSRRGATDRVEVWYGSVDEGLVGPETVVDVDSVDSAWLADVDEDGLSDLLIRAGGPIDLYLNEGGTFPSAEPIPGSDGYVYVFDTNADAHVDLIADTASGIAIGLGDGAGSFVWLEPMATEIGLLLPDGDVDGDANVDLVLVDYSTEGMPAPMSVYVYLGRGDGRFDAPPREMTLPHSSDPMPTIGDLNGDGVDDLVMVVTGVPSPEPSITTGFGPGHTVFALVSNP